MTDTSSLPGELTAEDLDGHTLEDLVDYLDSGRVPVDESIERSPGCQLALESLERLRRLTTDMADEDEGAEEAEDSWVEWILSGIASDSRVGRRIPFPSPAGQDLAITEGAVRGLVRQAEQHLPGLVIGRCRLDGEIDSPTAQTRITVEACVPFGSPIPDQVERLRAQIMRNVTTHTELVVTAIDIVVTDIYTNERDKGEQ